MRTLRAALHRWQRSDGAVMIAFTICMVLADGAILYLSGLIGGAR